MLAVLSDVDLTIDYLLYTPTINFLPDRGCTAKTS